ncbi:MAG: hypothetical protein JW745_07125 [Sedimentisphaerales bacterium]|nr:hypothetical protein [Sedimentisphaerales bacterium]
MPEQKRKPLSAFILVLVAIAAICLVVYRNLPGKYKEFSYAPDLHNIQKTEKTGIISAHLSFKGLAPGCFSAGLINGQQVLAIALTDRVEIMDISGNVLSINKLGYRATALELTRQSENSILAVSNGQEISMFDPITGELLEKYPAAAENALITSLALDDSFLYAADGNNRLIWVYTRVKLADQTDPMAPCTLGEKQFYLPSAKFELTPAPDHTGIWAANTGHHRLDLFSPQSNDIIKSWGKSGFSLEAFSGCCNPGSFDIFPDGRFVTCEKGALLIKIFSTNGNFLALLADRTNFARPEAFKQLIFPLVQAGTDNKHVFILDVVSEEIIVIDTQAKPEPSESDQSQLK